MVPDLCQGVKVTLIPATNTGAQAQWGELGGTIDDSLMVCIV